VAQIPTESKPGYRRVRYPPPGVFCKRVWICLIAKELAFFVTTKSLQQYEPSRVKALAGADAEKRFVGRRFILGDACGKQIGAGAKSEVNGEGCATVMP
jgi:hypothetical protein